MFRKDLIDLLLDNPRSVRELAEDLEEPPARIADDLGHLLQSLRNMPYRAAVRPARCRHCGFVFREDKLRKPGKCPKCKGTWIEDPRIAIERTDH